MKRYHFYPEIPNDSIRFNHVFILRGLEGWIMLDEDKDTIPPGSISVDDLRTEMSKRCSDRCRELGVEDLTTKTFEPRPRPIGDPE